MAYVMPCYHPKAGYRYIKQKGPGDPYGTKEPTTRPCGSCIGCRLEYARQWAVRCMHEAAMHDNNSFLTLTYNNQNLPSDRSINKRDLQLFFKRLRKAGKEFKYYACGEYGDNFGRPHYHICLFGYSPEDQKAIRRGTFRYFKGRFSSTPECGLFRSDFIEKIWGKGFISVGEVTFDSAGYVARYCMKKVTGKKAGNHYRGKTPEFSLISKGIGKSWYEKYRTDCFPKDFVTVKGVKHPIPRYYDYLLEKEDPELYCEIKNKRIENSGYKGAPGKIQEWIKHEQYEKEVHKKKIIKPLTRKMHNEKNCVVHDI
jgi:hypothetical protein